jgi:hypothetical protein
MAMVAIKVWFRRAVLDAARVLVAFWGVVRCGFGPGEVGMGGREVRGGEWEGTFAIFEKMMRVFSVGRVGLLLH